MHRIQRLGAVLLSFAALFLLSACTSSILQRSWKSARATNVTFKHILALAAIPDLNERKAFEEAIKKAFAPVPVDVSYEMIPDLANVPAKEVLLYEFHQRGYDTMIVCLALSPKIDPTEYRIKPSEYVDYWDLRYQEQVAARSQRAESGRYQGGVEIKVYTLSDEKLVWWGVAANSSVEKREELAPAVAGTIHDAMRQAGFTQ